MPLEQPIANYLKTEDSVVWWWSLYHSPMTTLNTRAEISRAFFEPGNVCRLQPMARIIITTTDINVGLGDARRPRTQHEGLLAHAIACELCVELILFHLSKPLTSS